MTTVSPTPAQQVSGRDRSSGPRRSGPLGKTWLLVLLAAVVGAGAGGAWALRPHASPSLADLMALSPLPNRVSPGFTLTDQSGRTVSLAQYRGKAVVLEFMDPHCTDICPIVSQEFRRAYHDLGGNAARVEFIAINVNQYHEDVASVRQFTDEQQLNELPNWQFLTGTTGQLRTQWAAYGVAVEPNPTGDVVHSSIMYFIDPSGRQRYLATPQNSTTDLAQWGQGIARYAAALVRAN
jgi:cytochrome oxidase Cu insertion factor (SCO1/SenC/PrrC family)